MKQKIIFLFLTAIFFMNSGCAMNHEKTKKEIDCPMWEEIKKYIEK